MKDNPGKLRRHGRNIDAKLDYIIRLLTQIVTEEKHMALDLTALQAEVEKTVGIEESAVVLIQTIADELKAAAGDPAAVQALADKLAAAAGPLSDAVAANQPPAPPEPTV
jgi:low affinity Fe/Cu permease